MGDKRKRNESGSSGSGAKPKRKKVVMSLADKLKVLEMLENGESGVAVGKAFSVNESTIRGIKKSGADIRASAARGTPTSNKSIGRSRDVALEKTESALSIWIEDQTQKKVPLSFHLIQAKAIRVYDSLKTDQSPVFAASRGWFERFKKRQSLHNIKMTGESASADSVATAAFSQKLLKHIAEKGYLPEQVFNADETGLFWKKMPVSSALNKHARCLFSV